MTSGHRKGAPKSALSPCPAQPRLAAPRPALPSSHRLCITTLLICKQKERGSEEPLSPCPAPPGHTTTSTNSTTTDVIQPSFQRPHGHCSGRIAAATYLFNKINILKAKNHTVPAIPKQGVFDLCVDVHHIVGGSKAALSPGPAKPSPLPTTPRPCCQRRLWLAILSCPVLFFRG